LNDKRIPTLFSVNPYTITSDKLHLLVELGELEDIFAAIVVVIFHLKEDLKS
jgi:hypothetical protein